MSYYYSERENASIFNEDDIKELSANISKMFCNFVNQCVNNDGSLKKYIENYKGLLQLPIFAELHEQIDKLKAHISDLENGNDVSRNCNEMIDSDEEHIHLNVEETLQPNLLDEYNLTQQNAYDDGGDDGGDHGDESGGGDSDFQTYENNSKIVKFDIKSNALSAFNADTDNGEEEKVITDEEEGGERGDSPAEEEEEEEVTLVEYDGKDYYVTDPDCENGDIYENIDDEIGEHIGTIKDGEFNFF